MMSDKTLPKFQDFLRSRNLVPEKNISFYASWVSSFLSFSSRHQGLNRDELLTRFLDYLRGRGRVADWQVEHPRNVQQAVE